MQPNTQVIKEHKLGETMKQIQPMSSKKNLSRQSSPAMEEAQLSTKFAGRFVQILYMNLPLENIMAMSFDLGQGRRTE